MNFHPLYEDLFAFMRTNKLSTWVDPLNALLKHKLQEKPHGDLSKWLNAYHALPDIETSDVTLNCSRITARSDKALSDEQQAALERSLKNLMPWRKGPFELFDIHIDTEWRSDFKWDRIQPHISPLKNRLVLDVGCGSGYHAWRMFGEGAKQVIGIDPNNLFMLQFATIKKYCGPNAPVHFLPIRMEDVPPQLEAFDTTFSMGVLYHRRSPIDHLLELKGTLRNGGELVLETLVVEGETGYALMPEDRYAMMRNVWFIPSIGTLELWLLRAGFKDIRCIEQNFTSMNEQRATDWMHYQSLSDFLDPQDSNKTIEGYPAPRRATFVATK